MKTKVKDFNAVASAWDEKPRRVELAAAVAQAIRKHVYIPAGCRAM
jgi:hypothetical protein